MKIISRGRYIIVIIIIIIINITIIIIIIPQNICKMSGWKMGSDKYIAAHEMFADIWRKLQDAADENFDGIITEEEWVSEL